MQDKKPESESIEIDDHDETHILEARKRAKDSRDSKDKETKDPGRNS